MAAPRHHKTTPEEPTDGVYGQTVELLKLVVLNRRWDTPKAEMAQALDNVKGQLDKIYERLDK